VSIPRGKIIGHRLGPTVGSEEEYFARCDICGQIVDLRDLGAVLDHNGPLPHPVESRPASVVKSDP
jgi:hypothetical protein